MYYITTKTGTTGKKFASISKKMNECLVAQIKLSKKLGFKTWRDAYWVVSGGLSAVIFQNPEKVDKKVWKNVNDSKDEWMPRLNTKEGKEIQLLMSELPVTELGALNKCIDFNDNWKAIGFDARNKKYFCFMTEEKWNLKVPKDCTEITTTKYKQLFK